MQTLCKVRYDGSHFLGQPYKNKSNHKIFDIVAKDKASLGLESEKRKIDLFENEWAKENFPHAKGNGKNTYYDRFNESLKEPYYWCLENDYSADYTRSFLLSTIISDDDIMSEYGFNEYSRKIIELVDKFIYNQQHNAMSRKSRFRNKAYMNDWSYFITITYDDCIMYERITGNKWLRKAVGNKKGEYDRKWEIGVYWCSANRELIELEFRNRLKKKLQNKFAEKRGSWRYMGCFEYGEEGRLHFHGLLYTPHNEVEIYEREEFNYKTRQTEIRKSYKEFDRAFGRNTFDLVKDKGISFKQEIDYIIKYITKSGERAVYCRDLKGEEFMIIDDETLICLISIFSPYYVLHDDFEKDKIAVNKQKLYES